MTIRTYSRPAKLDDVLDDVRLAIEGRGLVIDHESFVGRMLERTGKDVGSTRRLYAEPSTSTEGVPELT